MVHVPVTSMEEKDSKLMENSKFIINELVLCYEPDPLKAKMLYDAKVLDIDITKDDKSRKVYEYYIHFQGWNKSWDRWVLENQVLKVNEVNRKLQTKFHDDAINKRKRKQKSSKHDSDDEDDKSVTSSGSGNSEDTRVSRRPLISLDIPKILAIRLEDDCYNIKRKKTLLHLPRKPSVNELFNEYYKHCEKVITTPEGRCLMNLNIVLEVLQGLNTYFNYYLFTLLLYNFEREQYNSLFSEFREGPCESSQTSIDLASNDLNSKFPPTPNISESSSRSNSRTSSICDDLTSMSTAPLLKEVLRTKSVRKRKGEEKSQNADKSCDCSSAKRSRKSSLSSPNSVVNYARTPQQKTATREMRSSRSKFDEVFPKEEKAIKPMEILTENIIDYSRTTTRSRRYAPKGSPQNAFKEQEKENEKDVKDSGKEVREDLGKVVSRPDSSMMEPSRDLSNTETPRDFSKTKAPRESSKDETPRDSSKTRTPENPTNKMLEEKNEEIEESLVVHEVGRKSCAWQLKINIETDCDVRGIEHKKCDDIDNVENENGCGNEVENGREAVKAEEDLYVVTSEAAESRIGSVNRKEEEPVSKVVAPPEKNEDEENKEKVETLIPLSKIEEENNGMIPNELAAGAKMEICLEDVIVGTKLDSKKEQCKAPNCVTDTKENKNEEQYPDDASSENISSTCLTDSNCNRLRRSVRSVKSTTVSESDEHEVLPMGSTARTFQASYKYDQKTSTQNKQDNSDTFMIFPLLENSDTPADLYGFEHMLRLFVKLPILLASTNINEPKVTVILKIVRHFLEYLSKRSDLFVDMATIYSESVI